MPTTKNARVQSTFEIIAPDGTAEAKKVINNILPVTEATQIFPQTIAGAQTNVLMPFGSVGLAKRLYLRSNYPITVKFNQSSDTGFSFGPGDGFLMSENGITALYVSTGSNATDVEVIVVE
jgi:hypothetical protein